MTSPLTIPVAVDIVALTVIEHTLHALVVRRGIEPFKDHLALPGGFLRGNEQTEEAAARELEEETGIKVIYNTFDSNENLYSRIQTTSYDVIIPSDYAISRFIDEDMLQPLNYDHIPNMKLIDEKYTHLDFDPEQKYSVQ